MRLIRHTVRAIRWVTWVPVLMMTGLVAWVVTEQTSDFLSRQLYLRAGFLIAALGICFAFDDSAASTTDETPSPLWQRRVIRVALSAVPWLAAVVSVLVAGAQADMVAVWSVPSDLQPWQLPVGRLLLEASAMAGLGLAIAGMVVRRGDDQPGWISSTVLLVLYATSWLVPERFRPWGVPGQEHWAASGFGWWLVLAVGVALVVIMSWDTRRGLGRGLGGITSRYRGVEHPRGRRPGRDMTALSPRIPATRSATTPRRGSGTGRNDAR